jgi:hypothetical protein
VLENYDRETETERREARGGETIESSRLNGGPINRICSFEEMPENVDKQFLNIARLRDGRVSEGDGKRRIYYLKSWISILTV